MENLVGLLKIHVCRGVDLAIRDVNTSDPYLIVRLGKQKLKTHVVKKNLNPEWDEDLTLSITDQNKSQPIRLQVYDHDIFSPDDKMGDAEFGIDTLLEVANMDLSGLPDGTVIKRVIPSRQNCLAEESSVCWAKGGITQNLFIRLQNVECGQVELKIKWIKLSDRKAI